MKKLLFVAVLFCLLASASQVSAQLVIRNSGHAEIGVNPSANDTDTATVLKLFGNEAAYGAGAHITFGDSARVVIGELGDTNTDFLWLHGKNGIYVTTTTVNNPTDTVAYLFVNGTPQVHFNYNVFTSGMFLESDEQFKENIEPVSDVLTSLDNLEAVTYNLKKYSNLNKEESERYGFLAQNVKDVFPQLVHTDNSGYMYVDYIGLIPILVQSINELRAELAAVKGEKQQEEPVPAMMAPQQSAQNELEAGLTSAKLYQNAPNPWNSETVIRYRLPESVAKADIYIYDMQGAQIKSIPAPGRGESQVSLTAHDLKAGMYLYALVADGALVDSKQMILTK